jgi:hypothetical protein
MLCLRAKMSKPATLGGTKVATKPPSLPAAETRSVGSVGAVSPLRKFRDRLNNWSQFVTSPLAYLVLPIGYLSKGVNEGWETIAFMLWNAALLLMWNTNDQRRAAAGNATASSKTKVVVFTCAQQVLLCMSVAVDAKKIPQEAL